MARLVGADADPLLAGRRHRPGVAVAHDGAVDPAVEVGAAAVRVDLQPAADQRARRLDVLARAEHAAPAERVDDQRRSDVAAVGVDGDVGRRGPRRLPRRHVRDLEARVAALGPQLPAQLAVVERAPGPRQPVAGGAVRRVEGHARELLADRARDAHRTQPRRRRGAGGGGALADLVAVEDQHVGAGAGQLARDGQPGEARAADQHVGARALQRSALRPAQRGAAGHRRSAP